MLLLEFYKAKASCERNKPNFINHCRRNGKTSYIALTKELPFDKDVDVTGRDNGQYGIYRDSSGRVLKDLIRVTKEYCNSEQDMIYQDLGDTGKAFVKKIIRGYDYISGYWTFEEMKLYNTDDGNFDRVDSLMYCLHYAQSEELSFANKVVISDSKEVDNTRFDKQQIIVKKYNTSHKYVKKYSLNNNLI